MQSTASFVVFLAAGIALGCTGRDAAGPVATAAATPSPASHEPIAVAIAYSGQEIWIGNDQVEPDPAAQYEGALEGLKAAIDGLELERRGPGDIGLIVRYAKSSELVLAPGPLARVNGAVLGTQQDYHRRASTDLTGGVDLALTELERTSPKRKVLIVIGDGNGDTSTTEADLARAKLRAAAAGITVFALVHKGLLSEERDAVRALTPDVVTARLSTDLPARLRSVFQQCCE